MDTTPLLQRTRDLLNNCDRSLTEISVGAGVGYEWLRKFKSECEHDFGVNRVQALHDYLVDNQHPTPTAANEARAPR